MERAETYSFGMVENLRLPASIRFFLQPRQNTFRHSHYDIKI